MAAPGAETTFLVRYGEIGLKSLPVRRRFERLLADNLLRGLAARGAAGRLTPVWGRLFLHAPDAPGRAALAHTFGIVSASPAVQAPVALDALAAFVAEQAAVIAPRSTFAIRARRTGEVGYTSMDLARAAGKAVLDRHAARGLRVDLDAPQAEVIVEVREGAAWVAFESLPGPGGLPVGSEGRVAAWLASPRDAMAAWMAMKRGCRVDLLAPAGAGDDLARRLAAWDPGVELTRVDADPHDRALVLALLEAHARRRKGAAVVVGDTFDEAVALAPLDRLLHVPVFRPLLALQPAMSAQAADALGVVPEPARAVGPATPPGDPAGLRAKAAEMLRGGQRAKVQP